MKRREFVGKSLGASLLPLTAQAAAGAAEQAGAGGSRLLELRAYHLRFGPMEARFGEYVKGALIPALNRAGIKPVGAFTVLFGPDNPTLRLLLPHPDAASVMSLEASMEADAEYRRAAASFLALSPADPPYVRLESSLMATFDRLGALDPPAGPTAVASRVFELRTYESHSEAARRKKMDMFETAGEVPIFRRLAMNPVFFGRNLAGAPLPSLTYMLVFADLAAREKNWAAFRDDPEWVKLRSTPGFSNAEILTSINVLLLRPAEYSQV